MNFVVHKKPPDGGYILMDNGETVAISRNKKEEFQRLLSL
jgi:hypothetical protein